MVTVAEESDRSQRAVFLDRDGVINLSVVKDGKPYPPRTKKEFCYVEGVAKVLSGFKELGYLLIIVTNQPDVLDSEAAEKMMSYVHGRICADLPVDDIYFCSHRDSENYKPNPGMLLAAAEKHGIILSESFMIGDRWRDIGAGKAAGCTTIFIDYGYDEDKVYAPDHTVGSLIDAGRLVKKCRKVEQK